ncbi:MAG TPA: ATP-binding protein, partial [Actinoplanes sp.]|nr:ATP-binding protein [Actinoplanes sp.]
ETDPQELEDLYRVDHLATRMRRHAEDLVILAGAAPGRGWRNPITMIDVVRGAISEVEDYKRIDVALMETSMIVGRAVGDVIHLLAELFENAASYSPPTTRVSVTGQVLPNGFAIEIEDRGLGMSHEAIETANRKLAQPPDFDPTESARLGLFVVARLATRQNIRVALRASAYGGITAIVLIPAELIAGENDTEAPAPPGVDGIAGLNGAAPRPAPAREIPAGDFSAPTPSTVLDGLSSDGLAQRRRGAPPTDTPPGPPVHLPPNMDSPIAFRSPGPVGLPPNIYLDGVLRPAGPGNLHQPRRTAPADDDQLADESLLPRRVRQSNLAPRLREPARNQDQTPAPRPADQARGIMNSLQNGTNRGRRDAASPNDNQQYR